MSARATSMLLLAAAAASLAATGCGQAIEAGGRPTVEKADDDPLNVTADVPAGSLDALHRDVITRSCAGQAGLCHNGQFEPNLSTPALAYENLVLRPGLEHKKQLRVAPGDPAASLIIDKLRNRDVISRMPLGADPLPEEEIAAIEKWIVDGALRRPGAEPAPTLNNPPDEPLIGVFDAGGTRLDALGPFTTPAGTSLTFRASVSDFETDDAKIPFAAFILQDTNLRQVLLNPAAPPQNGGNIGAAHFDDVAAPEAKGEVLNWRWDYALPDLVDVVNDDGTVSQDVPTAGLTFTVTAVYIDGPIESGGMLTFAFAQNLFQVKP
jgi:hypothetical protein